MRTVLGYVQGRAIWSDNVPSEAQTRRISGSLLVVPSTEKPRAPKVAMGSCQRCGAQIHARNNRALFCSLQCQRRAKTARASARRRAA